VQQKIKFYKKLCSEKISVVLIFAKYNDKWLLCKHKDRQTWEICGGHIEEGEQPLDAAKRELYEESGAIAKDIEKIGYYSIYSQKNDKKFGTVYIAKILKLDKLPNFEMREINFFDEFPFDTTYPNVYKKLLKEIKKRHEYF